MHKPVVRGVDRGSNNDIKYLSRNVDVQQRKMYDVNIFIALRQISLVKAIDLCDSAYLNAMNASPNSPPTMWTPPSGMLRPLKNWRMSNALADHARFCSLIMTLIFDSSFDACICNRANEKATKL